MQTLSCVFFIGEMERSWLQLLRYVRLPCVREPLRSTQAAGTGCMRMPMLSSPDSWMRPCSRRRAAGGAEPLLLVCTTVQLMLRLLLDDRPGLLLPFKASLLSPVPANVHHSKLLTSCATTLCNAHAAVAPHAPLAKSRCSLCGSSQAGMIGHAVRTRRQPPGCATCRPCRTVCAGLIWFVHLVFGCHSKLPAAGHAQRGTLSLCRLDSTLALSCPIPVHYAVPSWQTQECGIMQLQHYPPDLT